MASNAKWRVARPTWQDEFKYGEMLRKMREAGIYDIWVAHFEVTQALPNALADIIEGYTDAFDSINTVTTAIHIESSDADDTDGGAGCEGVHIVYIKGNEITDTLFPTAGAAHSEVVDGTWDRLIGMYVDLATTVVPQGNITLKNHAETAVYCTIIAGDTYSITSKMWVPSGYEGLVVSVVPLYTIVEAAGPLLTDGSNVGININGTVQSRSVLPENIGRALVDPMPFNLPLDGEAYICLQHSQLDTDATAMTQTLNADYLIYK